MSSIEVGFANKAHDTRLMLHIPRMVSDDYHVRFLVRRCHETLGSCAAYTVTRCAIDLT